MSLGILGLWQSFSAWLGAPPAAVDPILLLPFCVVAFSLVQLRRCIRAGWYHEEAWVPPDRG